MSNGTTRPIRLPNPARGYLVRRGFTEVEVFEAIRQGRWRSPHQGRWEASWEFAYNSDWNGRYYATKRVRPIFVEEAAEIVDRRGYALYVFLLKEQVHYANPI